MAISVVHAVLLLTTVGTLGLEAFEFEIRIPDGRPLSDDAYLCTAQKLNGDTKYITGFERAKNSPHAHHLLLYGCDGEPGSTDSYWDCTGGPICASGTQERILFAWAMDAPGFRMPKDTAFMSGNGKNIYLVLQVHYKDVQDFRNDMTLQDQSGLAITAQFEPTANLADIMIFVGSGAIPAHSNTTMSVACGKANTARIHPFAFRVHAHRLSDRIEASVSQYGKQFEIIGRQSPKKPQTFYPVAATSPKTINPGNWMKASCFFENNTPDEVVTGHAAKDEMCNFYLMYSVPAEDEPKLISDDFFCNESGLKADKAELKMREEQLDEEYQQMLDEADEFSTNPFRERNY